VGFRTRWLLVSLSASSAVALAGCGAGSSKPSGPRLERADAASLIVLADAVARDASARPCAAAREIERLQARAIALVNTRRVPAALQDPMLSGVNALALDAPSCAPAPAPVTTTSPSPPAPKPEKHPHEKHGHGHGKHGGEGD